MRVVSKYEVSCPSCRVSYPVDQKRCVHCGGRTAPSVVEVPDAPPQLHQGAGPMTREREAEPALPPDAREMVFMPADGDEGELSGGGSMLSRLGGLTWILIFAVITIIRACFGGE